MSQILKVFASTRLCVLKWGHFDKYIPPRDSSTSQETGRAALMSSTWPVALEWPTTSQYQEGKIFPAVSLHLMLEFTYYQICRITWSSLEGRDSRLKVQCTSHLMAKPPLLPAQVAKTAIVLLCGRDSITPQPTIQCLKTSPRTYDTTNLRPTQCNSSPCSLSLNNSHKDGDICLLASTNKASLCTIIGYNSKSKKHHDQLIASRIIYCLVCSYVCVMFCLLCCIICCKAVRQHHKSKNKVCVHQAF